MQICIYLCNINFCICNKVYSIHEIETMLKNIIFFLLGGWVAGGVRRIEGIVIDCVIQHDAEFHTHSSRRYR